MSLPSDIKLEAEIIMAEPQCLFSFFGGDDDGPINSGRGVGLLWIMMR